MSFFNREIGKSIGNKIISKAGFYIINDQGIKLYDRQDFYYRKISSKRTNPYFLQL